LMRRGVLIIDDYGHREGARRAVDEYIMTNSLPLLLNRIDYTGRIAINRAGRDDNQLGRIVETYPPPRVSRPRATAGDRKTRNFA